GGVFVQDGGSLTISGGSFSAGGAAGGVAGYSPAYRYQYRPDLNPIIVKTATAGLGLGSAIFLQGNQTLAVAA
ncbi:hypothetical protein, partial [Bradyrhizobium neotropicale]|uniref:hypothetical protein n=1 Tax=Bradyrhizobium neotropicale TaxID=1497615 RepID=UPI0013747B3C